MSWNDTQEILVSVGQAFSISPPLRSALTVIQEKVTWGKFTSTEYGSNLAFCYRVNGVGKSCTDTLCMLCEATSWVKKSSSSFSISALELRGIVWRALHWESLTGYLFWNPHFLCYKDKWESIDFEMYVWLGTQRQFKPLKTLSHSLGLHALLFPIIYYWQIRNDSTSGNTIPTWVGRPVPCWRCLWLWNLAWSACTISVIT